MWGWMWDDDGSVLFVVTVGTEWGNWSSSFLAHGHGGDHMCCATKQDSTWQNVCKVMETVGYRVKPCTPCSVLIVWARVAVSTLPIRAVSPVWLCRLQHCCFCPVTQSCPTLCDPTDCSMPAFPVLHYLLGFAQMHVHWVNDAIQPSHSQYISYQLKSMNSVWRWQLPVSPTKCCHVEKGFRILSDVPDFLRKQNLILH